MKFGLPFEAFFLTPWLLPTAAVALRLGDDSPAEPPPVPFQALLISFPGSGNTAVRYAFEQVTGKIGSTNSVYYTESLLPVLPGEGRLDGGGLLKVHWLDDYGCDYQIDSESKAAIKATSKRIYLLRNPYDAIWSFYQSAKTGSHGTRILRDDFEPEDFAQFALSQASTFQDFMVDMVDYADQGSTIFGENTLARSYEELVKAPQEQIAGILEFLGEEALSPTYNDDGLKNLIDHPLIHREPLTSEHVSRSFAYFSKGRNLVDQMWDIFGEGTGLFGYKKPEPMPEEMMHGRTKSRVDLRFKPAELSAAADDGSNLLEQDNGSRIDLRFLSITANSMSRLQ